MGGLIPGGADGFADFGLEGFGDGYNPALKSSECRVREALGKMFRDFRERSFQIGLNLLRSSLHFANGLVRSAVQRLGCGVDAGCYGLAGFFGLLGEELLDFL